MARRCAPRVASSRPLHEVKNGGPPPNGIVVGQFPPMQRLREWYASPEYPEALKVRRTALDRRLIFVEGIPPV